MYQKKALFLAFFLPRQHQIEQYGHQCGHHHRGLSEDGRHRLRELCQGLCRLGNAHTQCGGKPDDRGVSGGQPLGGDELHAGHGDGGKHRRRGPAQHALRDGGEYGGKFRNDTGKQ